jgi:hypothetical protein
MSPMEAMARIAALVPPPHSPLLRYHGVLAAGSPLRRHIVPLRDKSQQQACTHRPEADVAAVAAKPKPAPPEAKRASNASPSPGASSTPPSLVLAADE